MRSENKATGFAIFNRASISEKDRLKDSFCMSKCGELTWITELLSNESYNRTESGYVLCCEFHEFKRTIREMPNLENINELLK